MCSYTRNDATKIFTIELKANNETVATFLPDEKPRLTTKGRYLEGRVTLMNISKVSTEAVMIFNNLTCDDQTNYSCSIVFLGQNGRTEESHSGFTTLNVKGSKLIVSLQIKNLKLTKRTNQLQRINNFKNQRI